MEFNLQIFLIVFSSCLTGVVSFLLYKIKKRDAEKEKVLQEFFKRDAAINNALRALCRDRILQGYRYYKRHNGITAQDLETMSKLYEAYHALGGNGTITAVYDKILALPILEGV